MDDIRGATCGGESGEKRPPDATEGHVRTARLDPMPLTLGRVGGSTDTRGGVPWLLGWSIVWRL
ncbi:hypothetical protein ACH47Z_43475, partial [Streptomyces sp. NPDC020192]|uniref:hypothetical protein n=1 Tax=Streptomyces sp. NPDC020192 TaxID=3365066 RepID=UPI0037AC9BC2